MAKPIFIAEENHLPINEIYRIKIEFKDPIPYYNAFCYLSNKDKAEYTVFKDQSIELLTKVVSDHGKPNQ